MKKLLLGLFFVIGGFLLRFNDYYLFPVFGETADEGAWTHLGASLIQERWPASWSYFPAYQNGYVYQTGVYDAPIVRPVFDHPPLFSLLPGLAHSLKNHWLDLPSAKLIRLPMVLVGAVNVGLFWLLAAKFFKKNIWAILATLLFMTIPTLIFGSRLVVAENLLVTWLILSFWALLNLDKKWSWQVIFWVGAASVLTKAAGLVIPLSVLAVAFMERNWRLFRVSFFSLVLGISLFIIYGAIYDFSLFLQLLAAQSNRDLGLVTLQNRLFLHPTVIRHLLFDGWKILGLFAAILLFGREDKKYLFLKIALLLNLVFILFTVGATTFHGWYDYLLWPLLIISLVELIKLILEKNLFLLAGLQWLLLLPLFNLVSGLELSLWQLRGVISLGFVPVLFQSLNFKKLAKLTYILILGLLIITNVIVTLTFDQQSYWDQAEFFEENMPKVR